MGTCYEHDDEGVGLEYDVEISRTEFRLGYPGAPDPLFPEHTFSYSEIPGLRAALDWVEEHQPRVTCFAVGPLVQAGPILDAEDIVPPDALYADIPLGTAYYLNPAHIATAPVCWLAGGHDGPHAWDTE